MLYYIYMSYKPQGIRIIYAEFNTSCRNSPRSSCRRAQKSAGELKCAFWKGLQLWLRIQLKPKATHAFAICPCALLPLLLKQKPNLSSCPASNSSYQVFTLNYTFARPKLLISCTGVQTTILSSASELRMSKTEIALLETELLFPMLAWEETA